MLVKSGGKMKSLCTLFAISLLLIVPGCVYCQQAATDPGTILVQCHLLLTGYLNGPRQIDGLYGNTTDAALQRYALASKYNLADRDSFSLQLYKDVGADSSIFPKLESIGYSRIQVAEWLAHFDSRPLVATPKWVGVKLPSAYSNGVQPSYGSSKSSSGTGSVHVKGYYRKDGTYVRPHTRSQARRH